MLEEYARHLLEGWYPVIVANRAPVEVQRRGARYIATRGAGGLVSALSTLASSTDAVWVGCARTDADRAVAEKHPRSPVSITGEDGRTYRIGFVTPDEETYDMYYNQIATRCSGSCSTTSGTSATIPPSTPTSTTPGPRATSRSTAFSRSAWCRPRGAAGPARRSAAGR